MKRLSAILITIVILCGLEWRFRRIHIVPTTSFLEVFVRGLPTASNPDYGQTETHPIKLGAPDSADPMSEGRRNRTYFLLSLRGPSGQRVRYWRRGSCCSQDGAHGFFGSEPLDVFVVTYHGLETPVELFLNVYSFDDPQVPLGFTFKPTVVEKWPKVMFDNPWWTQLWERGLRTP
jgi:hypothetical protein